MEMKYKMNMAGTDMSGTMYMKDKALYTEFMGQKVKTDTSNEMGAMMKVDTDELLSITEEMISDLKVSRDGEDTVYNFTMDPTKAMDYMAKNVSGAEGITDADGKLTFDKANISVTADKNDMAKKIDVDFSLKAKLDEETVAMKFKTTVEFVSINTDLTIDFPDIECAFYHVGKNNIEHPRFNKILPKVCRYCAMLGKILIFKSENTSHCMEKSIIGTICRTSIVSASGQNLC